MACLLMMDANMWRDVVTVILFTYDVGSIFCATFARASCTALMVASGVSSKNYYEVYTQTSRASLTEHSSACENPKII